MKAFIQKQFHEWLNENCFFSSIGFYRMGYEIVPFEMETINIVKPENDDVVHGGIFAIRKIIDQLGLKQPEIHNPHNYLLKYTGRTFKERVLKDILYEYEQVNNISTFIKPLDEHKLFTGFIVKSFADFIKIAHIDRNTKILQSSVSNFVSEYRCFIHRKKLVGCKNYTGDFKIFPDFELIESAVEDYKEQPIACSLDFGITDSEETQLIEINDGFALASYGLNPILYCRMIQDRWYEITC